MNLKDLSISALFDSAETIAWDFLKDLEYSWDALPLIPSYVQELSKKLDASEYIKRENNVWIHKAATVAPTAYLGADIIVGANTFIGHCAYVRGPAIIGEDVGIGNSTEVKNCILFNKASIPHFNYVGDSIMGYKSHFGAGVITSNVKSDSSLVSVNFDCERIDTPLKKFGAIVGDNVEVGCNAVLNPGTVLGANATVYPLSMVRGFVPANSIYKKTGEVVEKR